MANESVTASKTDEAFEVFNELAQGIERLRDAQRANSGDAEPVKRCKHDVEMVNEVSARLIKIKAIADLMLSSRSGDLAEDTVTNIGWLLIDMVDETKAIVCESQEVAA